MTELRKRIIRKRWTVIALVVLVLIAGVASLASGNSDLGLRFKQACHDQLGPEWKYGGYADLPGVDHYHVKCIRNPGFFGYGDESRWITVPKESNGVEDDPSLVWSDWKTPERGQSDAIRAQS